MTAAPAIAVSALSKRYGERAVLSDVSLTVEAGELVALLGPNGAGKTTAVEIIEGYRTADGGSVRVLGVDPRTGGPTLKARVGLMLQGGGFDMRARPRETLVQYGGFHRSPRDPDELLELVGLRAVARTPFRRLSGGERQRLGLAVALVGRPEVAILDEPTAGMDPEARAVTRAIIAGLRADGVAILLTSHDLSDVERLADRIAIIDEGRLVASGSPATLMAAAVPTFRFRLARVLTPDEVVALAAVVSRGSDDARLEPDDDRAAGTGQTDGRYVVRGTPPGPALIAAIAAWCAAADILIVETHTSGASLEEAYLAVLGAGRSAREALS